MTYVIGAPCIDVLDRACVEECPVDCIYEGARTLYINPVEAIFYEDDLPSAFGPFLADNAAFFDEALPGRSAPLGAPGGAAAFGVVGADTGLVANYPGRAPSEQVNP